MVFNNLNAQALHSAYRVPTESFGHSLGRYIKKLRTITPYSSGQGTPIQKKKFYQDLDLSILPEWNDLKQANRFFRLLRDSRFLRNNIEFPRRVSWLYPQDGCWLRAEVGKTFLNQWRAPKLAKVFIFGNLKVTTPNAPKGFVTWWYHVAPSFRIGEKAYIIDPAIEPKGPILLSKWILKQVPKLEQAKISICHEHTFSPSSQCFQAKKLSFSNTLKGQYKYLNREWNNLITLKRDPKKELGSEPPWVIQ